MLESLSTLSTILTITSCCLGPVCVCATPPTPFHPSVSSHHNLHNNADAAKWGVCTCTSYPRRHMPIHATNAHAMRNWGCTCRLSISSFPSPVTRLHRLPTFDSCTRTHTTLVPCTALQTTLQGFPNTRTVLNSRNTQSKLWLSSNVMKVLVVKIFNLPFSCIFNSAITVHTSFHQYSILLIKFASVRGWSTALNMCTMEWYIFDVIPSWFEAGVPPEPDKTWKLSIGAGIDMYTSSLLYFSTVWT